MRLVLFDVDGTLTVSQSIDTVLYARSLSEVFGFENVDTDWSVYRHTSDIGILQELFVTRLNREPAAAEIEAFRNHFVQAIDAAAAVQPFEEIKGAKRVLAHLRSLPTHRIGFATGGWSTSAQRKLKSAGLHFDGLPFASSDDAAARTDIMRIAIERAGMRPTDSIVYIGDAVWDARACRELQIPFIGIGAGDDARRLIEEGARAVFADYSDLPRFCAMLD